MNLVAYMPVLNKQYIDWIYKYRGSNLYLISQTLAEKLIPRINRNIINLDVNFVAKILRRVELMENIYILDDVCGLEKLCDICMPEEDLSFAFCEKAGLTGVKFDNISARWDMTAVKKAEPVLVDCEISSDEVDVRRINFVKKIAEDSPDWWRQVGAVAYRGSSLLASSCNMHFRDRYETAILGDPRINFDAGDPSGSEVYLSIHAEKAIISECARKGVSLKGASVYVTTFPCADCAKMLALSGISELYFFEGYSVLNGFDILKNAGVKIIRITPKSV